MTGQDMGDVDDDEISVTSTIDENSDSDNEWPVNRVLAEGEVDGEVIYLIEWQGFSLAEATWEPRSNLKDALMADWEQTKLAQKKGLEPKFLIAEWKEASIKQFQSKLSRHERRNHKRVRLGLPETVWEMTLQDLINGFENLPKDDDEREVRPQQQRPSGSGNQSENPLTPSLQSVRTKSSTDYLGNSNNSRRKTAQILNRPSTVTSTSTYSGLSGDDAYHPSKATIMHRRPFVTDASRPPRPKLNTSRSLSASSPVSPLVSDNVFAGGKTRKEKPKLRDAALDPQRDPKFLTARLQRRLELQQRDREGIIAPHRRPSGMISLDQNHVDAISGEYSTPEKSDETMQDKLNEDGRDKPEVTLEMPEDAIPKPGSSKIKKKKRRSVHWEDDPMELDPEESLFVPEQTVLSPTNPLYTHPALPQAAKEIAGSSQCSPIRRISPEAHQARSPQEILNKSIQLAGDSQILQLSFVGAVVNNDLPWFTKFSSRDHFIFTHICLAKDFLSQTRSDGAPEKFWEGTVSSDRDIAALRNLASRLRHGSRGVLSRSDDFCVLLFPPNSGDWLCEQASEDATLQYLIFESTRLVDASMLAPVPCLLASNTQATKSTLYLRPFERLFGQRYDQLLPSSAIGNTTKHNFFLAFPLRAGQESAMLSWWLRSLSNDCDIRTSIFPGHWSSFLRLSHGTIIVHEDALWAVRLFSGMSDILQKPSSNFKIWVLKRSVLPLSPFASMDATVPAVGDVSLQQIFRHGTIFLVTPSFLVSQPVEAYSFLKWFWATYYKTSDALRTGKLFVCTGIDDWVYNLAMEKISLRTANLEASSIEEPKHQHSSDAALEARLKTWKVFRQLAAASVDEKSNHLVFASKLIDGNDEQSLINWFGYWSISNIDQFRRFIVLGSSRQIGVRLSRMIQTPKFDNRIVNDPDEFYDLPEASHLPSVPNHEVRVNREDIASVFSDRLVGISKGLQGRSWCPVTLYWFPVSYGDPDTSFNIGDIRSKFKAYSTWFRFFWQDFLLHALKSQRNSRNTYAGYFYTMKGKWDGSPPMNQNHCLPWIAIFRPLNPHIRPWKASELFIWDIAHAEKVNNQASFHIDDLIEGQKELVRFLQEELRSALPLEKVWVGSFGSTQRTDISSSDATFQWLETAMDKVRDWLPAPAKDVPTRGWALVTSEMPHKGHVHTASDLMDIDAIEAANTKPSKTIFHPPLGDRRRDLTKCRNRLLQCTMESDPHLRGKTFEYVFRPTLDWYKEQCDEGRGFEHIKVATWDEVSKDLNINL